jgi:hypothetical protein
MSVDTAQTSAATAVDAARWFVRLYALAIAAHIAGNPTGFMEGWQDDITLALGLAAALLLAEPGRRWVLGTTAGLVLATVWMEAPFIGNHWLVMGFVSLAVLVSLLRADWWGWFAPTSRWILLAFYGFAAFAKLNAGFFDPSVSCGLFYANQSAQSWGLPALPASAGVGIAVATALIELAVPVLLILRRTRRYGVILGYLFHLLISFDLGQHFYDFTAVLFALFALFLAPESLAGFERRVRPMVAGAGAGAATILAVGASTGPNDVTRLILSLGAFAVWIPTGVLLAWAVLTDRTPGRPVSLRSPDGWSVAIVGLVLFNALTPYLGLKTGYGFNMYANLVTHEGESNHFVIGRTLDLVDVEMVEVVEARGAGLEAYVGSGYLVPERNLMDLLAEHPDATVTYRRGDETISGSGAELGRELPVLIEKFGLFRSVDTADPPRCQTSWLPAY